MLKYPASTVSGSTAISASVRDAEAAADPCVYGLSHQALCQNAVKIARAATGRSAVIAFTGGFHGRTLLASALTGKIGPISAPLAPCPPRSALAVLDVIEDEQLCARADAIGARISQRVAQFSMRNDLLPITDLRGLGGMIAFKRARRTGS